MSALGQEQTFAVQKACTLYPRRAKRRQSGVILAVISPQAKANLVGVAFARRRRSGDFLTVLRVPGSLPGGVWLRFQWPRPARGSWMQFDRNRWRRAPAIPWASW